LASSSGQTVEPDAFEGARDRGIIDAVCASLADVDAMRLTAVFLGSVLLAGCWSTNFYPADEGTYVFVKRSAKFGFAQPSSVEADVQLEASRFCARQGKAVETVSLDTTKPSVAQPGKVSLRFRCV
jgi:hypothetical protein